MIKTSIIATAVLALVPRHTGFDRLPDWLSRSHWNGHPAAGVSRHGPATAR
jgi:hypothetical protein